MDAIRKYYTIPMFEEKACDKCEYRKNKPNENCEACQAFCGNLELFSVKRINGQDYCLLPNGNFPKLQKVTGIDFSTYADLRCRAKRVNKVVWTGQLRQGEVVNDIKSANQVEIVKQWLSPENRYGFIEAPPRTGKCLSGDTLVNTEDGLIYLNEIPLPEGDSPFEKNITTLDGVEKTTYFHRRKAKTIKLKTNKGVTIEGTYEHPLLVLNKDLTFSWKCLQDINVGDCVLGKPKKTRFLFGKTHLKKEEATLLGYLLANGRRTGITSSDSLVQRKLLLCASNLNIKVSISTSHNDCKHFNLLHFGQRLKELGYESGSRNKRLSFLMRTCDYESLKEILTSYFECDSGSNGTSINLISACEDLINQLQFILRYAFEISSEKRTFVTCAKNSKNPTDREYYMLVISGVDAYKFCKEFPTSKVARKYGNRFKRSKYNKQECNGIKFIPFIYEYFKDLFYKTLIDFNKINGKHYFSKSGVKDFFKLPFDLYRNNESYLLCHYEKWKTWCETSLKTKDFDSYIKLKRVLEISDDYHVVKEKVFTGEEKEVFDLEVPESHSFIANGIVSHNSVIGNYIAVRMGFKTLYIAHQKELLENFYKSLVRDTNLKQIEEETGKTIAKIIEKPKDFELIKDLDFCLITYQSFIHDFSKIKTYLIGNFGLAIIDEAHQAGAEVYAKFMSSLDCRYKLGLSATPLRKDVLNRVLFNVIGPVTVKSEAVGLVPEIEVLETGVQCKKRFNMWVYAMKFLQNDEYRNQLIVSEVEKDLKEHKCIIIPVDAKLHMTDLVNRINKRCGENTAIGYHSGVANRKNILKEIDSGMYRVVVAIKGMIKQGIDLLSPSMVYIQSPLSAQKPPVGAPFFYQLGNRVCTPYVGKRQPIIKLFIDDMPESYGCMMGLFMKEINPGLKPNDEGRPRYKTDPKTLNYFWRTLVHDVPKKEYRQIQGVKYNPKYDGERPSKSKNSSRKGSLSSFDF